MSEDCEKLYRRIREANAQCDSNRRLYAGACSRWRQATAALRLLAASFPGNCEFCIAFGPERCMGTPKRGMERRAFCTGTIIKVALEAAAQPVEEVQPSADRFPDTPWTAISVEEGYAIARVKDGVYEEFRDGLTWSEGAAKEIAVRLNTKVAQEVLRAARKVRRFEDSTKSPVDE